MTNKEKTLGYDVNAVLYIGPPSNRMQLDISKYIDSLTYTFANMVYLPFVQLNYVVNSYYVNMLSNPYELELSIIEKSEADVPRSRIGGRFVCFPRNVPTTFISDNESDTSRVHISEIFLPRDISSTLSNTTSLVCNNTNVEDALKKVFKLSATGSVSLKIGKLKNKKKYEQICFPLGRLQQHINCAIGKYGLGISAPIYYADFKNIYLHSVNETLVGNSQPITFFYSKDTQNKDTYNINNYCYYLRYPPKIQSKSGIHTNIYTSSTKVIQHPDDKLYNISDLNIEKEAKKSKTTKKSGVFDYFNQYNRTSSISIAGTNDTYSAEDSMMANLQNSFSVDVTVLDPMILTDWVIGRPVKFDTSIREYFGLELTGYINGYTVSLTSNKNKRWTGYASINVRSVSNSSIIK